MEKPRRSARVTHARWTDKQDTVLATAMVKQILQGKTTKNGFSKQAWSLVRMEFNQKTGCNYDKHQLRNRKGVLMSHYQIVKRLLEQPGFVWDETARMVTGEDALWDDYIKVNPEAEKFRTQCFPSYKLLCFVFGGISTKSSNDKSYQYLYLGDDTPAGTQQSAQEQADTNEPPVMSLPNLQDNDSTHLAEDPDIIAERRKRRSTTPSDSVRCRRRGSGASKLAEAVFEFADSMRFRTLASTPTGDPYAMGKCIKELEAIKGVTDEEVFGAINVFRDPLSREAFMTMETQRRLRWIRTQIN